MTRQRYTLPHDFGLGGVAIGNEFAFATDEQAEATLSAAWDAGVRYFDVSPWYGLGLAERRFGRFLARKPRDAFILSSKVGKLLRAARDNDGRRYFPFSPSPNTPHFDYTADGVLRSIEDSLQRLVSTGSTSSSSTTCRPTTHSCPKIGKLCGRSPKEAPSRPSPGCATKA